MYVNAFLLGVLATLFVEMAIVILTCVVAPKVSAKQRKNVNNTRTNKEVK